MAGEPGGVRPRPRRPDPPSPAPPEPARSRVSLWRNAAGKPKWSISIVAGTTEAEVDELVRLARHAEDRLNDPESGR